MGETGVVVSISAARIVLRKGPSGGSLDYLTEERSVPGITIDKNHCKGCELCVRACPQKILSMSTEITVRGYFHARMHDPSRCIGCRICAITCPDVAIEVHTAGTMFRLFDY
jgi:2-oxoglutarate ferredoxin oxidoreductase subunit delta